VEKNWIDDSCQATNHLCPSIVHIHVYLSILVAACGSDFPLIKRNDRIHNTTLSTAYYVSWIIRHFASWLPLKFRKPIGMQWSMHIVIGIRVDVAVL
jgi:hypothetical protein